MRPAKHGWAILCSLASGEANDQIRKNNRSSRHDGCVAGSFKRLPEKEGPVEQAGKKVDQATEKVGHEIEKAGSKIQDAAQGDKK